MNRKFSIIAICVLLASALFTGCAAKTTAEIDAPAPSAQLPAQTATIEVPPTDAPESAEETENAKAEQAYMDFLNGKTSVTTSEKFREDDQDYNFDGLTYGEYDYAALKAAITELESKEMTVKYAFLDLGHDGVNELALRFENTDPGFMSWVGIIRYNGKGLELNYSYEDGYRTFSALYTSGYLQTGGAMSAGATISSIVEFDGNGVGRDVFTETDYYGIFACGIVYDLCEDGDGLTGIFDDITNDSQLFVREYKSGDTVKIAASMWSKDPAIRQREESLITELSKLGATVVTSGEMDALCSLAPYVSDEVVWQNWNGAQ